MKEFDVWGPDSEPWEGEYHALTSLSGTIMMLIQSMPRRIAQ